MRAPLHLVAFVLALPCTAQNPFARTYGGTLTGQTAFAASPDAYYLLHNTPDGPELQKVALDGGLLWSRTLQFGIIPLGVYRIAFADGALYVTGGHQNGGYRNFLVKLDTDGAVIWATEINPGDININSRIHVLADGVLLVGQRDYLDGGSFTYDLTLMRFAGTGQFLWGRAYGATSYNLSGQASVIASNGDLLVSGIYSVGSSPSHGPEMLMLVRFNSSGDLLWMRSHEDPGAFLTDFQPTDLIITSDGHYALAGSTYNTNFNWDAHVLLFDDDGEIQWARRFYRIGWYESARTLMEDDQQRLVVGGCYALGVENGQLGIRLQLDGDLVDAAGLAGTGFEDAPAEYEASGRELAEVDGWGYVVSSSYRPTLIAEHRQTLAAFPYDVGVDCAGATIPYPLDTTEFTWTPTVFTSLPSYTASMSAMAITMTTAPLTNASAELCVLITGVEEMPGAGTSAMIYPNPAYDRFTVRCNTSTIQRVELLNAHGEQVQVKVLLCNAAGLELDAHGAPPGLYLIHMVTRRGVMLEQVVLE